MMGSGRARGWIIIGMDLLIVLGIYFLYSQFAFQSREPSVSSFENELKYYLKVNDTGGDTIPVTVTLTNTNEAPRTAELPNGILLLLTDGRDRKFWSQRLLDATTITLNPNESRSWQLAGQRPDTETSLFVEMFIDRDRQTRVQVP